MQVTVQVSHGRYKFADFTPGYNGVETSVKNNQVDILDPVFL